MANISDYTYETIENPYDNDLERTESTDGGLDSTDDGVLRSPADIAPESLGEQSLGDLWIDNFIKSRSYSPKKQGFYLNSKEGYIECMKLYVGEGGIVGGRLDIPNRDITTNSFHVDETGAGWVGATETNRASAPFIWTAAGSISVTGGSITGSTITGGTIQTAVTGVRTVITGNDIYFYDDTTGGGGTITGNTASVNFPRTDSKPGTFIIQKRSSSVHDSGNIMEMYHNAAANDSADNYLFIGTYGLASTGAVNYTDITRIHGKALIQVGTDAPLDQVVAPEIQTYTAYAAATPGFNTDDCSRVTIFAVEGNTPDAYDWTDGTGGAVVALGISKSAGSDSSLWIDTGGGWFGNDFKPYATESIDLGSSSLKFDYIYTKYIGDSGSTNGIEYLYFSSSTRTRSLYAASTYDIVAEENFKIAGYLYLGSTDHYLRNNAGSLEWNGAALGTGTVTSVATTGAITGGTFTTSGTIAHSTSAGYKHIPTGTNTYQTLYNNGSGSAGWTSYLYMGGSSSYSWSVSSSRITSSADVVASGSLHTTGNLYTGGISDNDGAVYCGTVGGANGTIYFNQTGRIQVSNHFDPPNAGFTNLGGSSRYWADVSYKTLSDRGCLGWFDDGVELQDGTFVSDIEALQAIQKHPTKKTVYGAPMLDYKTFPKISYKKAADHDGNEYARDKDDEPIEIDEDTITFDGEKNVISTEKALPQDAIEMTSMFSIMIGALKELDNRLKILESK